MNDEPPGRDVLRMDITKNEVLVQLTNFLDVAHRQQSLFDRDEAQKKDIQDRLAEVEKYKVHLHVLMEGLLDTYLAKAGKGV